MTSDTHTTPADLWFRLGTADAPEILDVRVPDDVAADPRSIPGARARSHHDVADWSRDWAGRAVVVSCQRGLKLSEGVAAWLRQRGARASVLADGHVGWVAAGLPLVPHDALPTRAGATVWVTRERPKIDRIACPWLLRRFVDRDATFLFVAPDQVAAVADRFGAIPFDIEGVRWSHRGPLCTFDTMVEAFGLATEPLSMLARIVRGADTGDFDLDARAAGLLAISLGLSRLHADDLAQLEAALPVYDALYRWCLEARDETHTWRTTGA